MLNAIVDELHLKPSFQVAFGNTSAEVFLGMLGFFVKVITTGDSGIS